jgi:ABC-2 type transport system ATP-binding protein
MHNAVVLRTVTKRFGQKCVLGSTSLRLSAGSTLGLIGSNGCGKTTLIRTVLGLIRPDAGAVELFDLPVRIALARYRIAYFSGGRGLPPGVRVRHWARLFEAPGQLTGDWRRLGSLSRGQRQVVGLRSALAGPTPDLVVLDEPWEGLDPPGTEWLTRRIRTCHDDGATILIASHRLFDLTDVCDTYAILRYGLLTVRRRENQTQGSGDPAGWLHSVYNEPATPERY